MSLVTRCPNCDTTFKVTLPQLQAHRGDVRCGRCAEVFDAFADLSTVQATNETPADNSPLSILGGANDQWAEDALADRSEAASDNHTGSVSESESDTPGEADSRTEARNEPDEFGLDQFSELGQLPDLNPADVPGRQGSSAIAHASSRDDNFPPLADYPPAARPSLRSDFEPAFHGDPGEAATDPRTMRLWLGGSLFLLVLLLGQVAFVFRSDLATRFPGLKPPLQQFCKVLGCVVPLPHDWETLTVESSDLKSPDSAPPGQIELSASLRNRARYTVAYPALDLTLTNSRDETIARRIFEPREYLPATTDLAAGLPPNGDLNVKLTLDTGDLNPSGYRLFMLYP
ncbi:MAG: DUF3426 domain-containing protein [Burkholderiales bacterium]|nr:DUF3426 domain-containing protein [Burkholderiales bacterium]